MAFLFFTEQIWLTVALIGLILIVRHLVICALSCSEKRR